MRYIFIVDGEGREHFMEAMALEKILLGDGHEVAEILAGTNARRQVPEFFRRGVLAPIKEFTSRTASSTITAQRTFENSQSKADPACQTPHNTSEGFRSRTKHRSGPNVFTRMFFPTSRTLKYFPGIRFIRNRIRAVKPDVVVNFHELLVGLAYRLYRIRTPQICIGPDYLSLHRDLAPSRDWGSYITRIGSRRAVKRLALSLSHLQDDRRRKVKVVPPLLRQGIMTLRNEDGSPGPQLRRGNYILGYIPRSQLRSGYEEIVRMHNECPEIPVHIFWDKWSAGETYVYDGNLTFHLFDNDEYLKYLPGCGAFLAIQSPDKDTNAAGGKSCNTDCIKNIDTEEFGAVCEAIYLGKPILYNDFRIDPGFSPDIGFITRTRTAEQILLTELTTPIHRGKAHN